MPRKQIVRIPIATFSDETYREILQRLKERTAVDPITSCWKFDAKSARLSFQSREWSARLLAWAYMYRREPRLAHRIVATCGNFTCVNPEHTGEQPLGTQPVKIVTVLSATQQYRKRLREERPEELERQRLLARERRLGDPHQRLEAFKKGASKRGLDFLLGDTEAFDMFQQPCYYCAEPSSPTYLTGIDRKNNDLGYTTDNTVPCCSHCNRTKICLTETEFIKVRCHIASFNRLYDGSLYPHVFRRAAATVSQQLWSYKYHAKKRGGTDLHPSVFAQMLAAPCTYCGLPTANGIDRVDSKCGYVRGNVVPCCYTCNILKLTYSREEFLDKCAAVARMHGERMTDE
jgi:hypothetical protein